MDSWKVSIWTVYRCWGDFGTFGLGLNILRCTRLFGQSLDSFFLHIPLISSCFGEILSSCTRTSDVLNELCCLPFSSAKFKGCDRDCLATLQILLSSDRGSTARCASTFVYLGISWIPRYQVSIHLNTGRISVCYIQLLSSLALRLCMPLRI